MEKFNILKSIPANLPMMNVDTDMIIPKQFLKSIKRTGFGPNLFDEWRYLDHGEPGMDNSKRPLNPDFVMNKERYQGASILLARENFGCGSSREHAPWALEDYGIKAVIAPSYADIFFNNCFKNGILPIVLDHATMDTLFEQTEANEGYKLDIDLDKQTITLQSGDVISFEVESDRKHSLYNGLDDIGITLQQESAITEYEKERAKRAPWLFNS